MAKQDLKHMRRRFGWRGYLASFIGICFLIPVPIAVSAAVDLQLAGKGGDDIWAAVVMAGAFLFIGSGFIWGAFSRRDYVDDNGNIIPFIAMAHLLTDTGDIGGGDDGGGGID